MSAPTLTASTEFRRTWRRPAPFLDMARRVLCWRITEDWLSGGKEQQIVAAQRMWRRQWTELCTGDPQLAAIEEWCQRREEMTP